VYSTRSGASPMTINHADNQRQSVIGPRPAVLFEALVGLATNDEKIAGVDYSPGYLRAAAKKPAGS